METTATTSLPLTNEGYAAPENKVSSTLTQVGQWYVDTATEKDPDAGFGEQILGTTYATNYNAGMCYVIRLEDGSFIVVDGGYGTETHAENLYAVLEKQAEGSNIVIAAWIFTHAHADHAGTFTVFTQKYASMVTVESFIYNFPADISVELGTSTDNGDAKAVKNAMAAYPNAKTIVGHAGQVHEIRNAKVNILYTYEMMMPHKLLDYNTTSMVFNIELEGSKILFLGDAGGETDDNNGTLSRMSRIYTSSVLNADIVQVAHHGIDNHSKVTDFYDIIKSSVKYTLIPVAKEHVKISGDKYIDINERTAYKTLTKNRIIAGSSVTVLTLSGGNVTKTSYTNVADYVK